MFSLGRMLLLLLLLGLAWFAWQRPEQPPAGPQSVRMLLPAAPAVVAAAPEAETAQPEAGLWRLVTHRIVWHESVKALAKRLREAGLNPRQLQQLEQVEMHVFDDPRSFATHAEAARARHEWLVAGVQADILKAPGGKGYIVGLGRLYMSEYAEQLQSQLKRIGKPYRYERRNVELPVWRFVFPAMAKKDADTLWQRLQQMGVADPVLVPEDRFRELYPDVPAGM